LRQKDHARTDFAAIESDHEVIQKQLARLPTRRELTGTAFRISLATMMLMTLVSAFSALVGKIWVLHLPRAISCGSISPPALRGSAGLIPTAEHSATRARKDAKL
jgi:hypothetical protein